MIVPGFSTSYVPIQFNVGPYRGYLGAPGSVSLNRSCSNLEAKSTRPDIEQLLVMRSDGRRWGWAQALRDEFRDGRLAISVLIGSEWVILDPATIRGVMRLDWKSWQNLDPGAMYENPENFYPPTLPK